MKEQFKYLFKNTGLIFIGQFTSKVLVFLLIPLYTSVLSTEDYGSYDLLYITMQILLPIITLNVSDAVMRFSLGEKLKQKKLVFSIGTKYIVLSFVFMFVGAYIIGYIFNIQLFKSYFWHFFFLYVSYAANQIITQFSRGLNDIFGIAISGIVGTVIMLVANVYYLLIAKKGLEGYFYANILGVLTPAVFLFIRNRMYTYWTSLKVLQDNKVFEKQFLLYSIPLVFTALSWYINGVSDRYVIIYFRGIAENGIYSVSCKIPAMLGVIQGIFIQAWQLSAINEYGNENRDGFYKKIYCGCQFVMIILCSLLIMCTRILAKIFFAKDFYIAWFCVPTLLLYMVFNALSGILGGALSAVKDAKAFAQSAIIGSLINIVLNIIMVYLWGMEGAAIATVISSIVIWRMRLHYARFYVKFDLNEKLYCFEYILLVIQSFLMTVINNNFVYILQIGIFLCFFIINIKSIKGALSDLRNAK